MLPQTFTDIFNRLRHVSSRAAEPEDSEAILETEQRLEKIRRGLQEKESQELEQLRQRQVEAEQELEQLKRRREERRRAREEEERRREEEEQQRLAREEVSKHHFYLVAKPDSVLRFEIICYRVNASSRKKFLRASAKSGGYPNLEPNYRCNRLTQQKAKASPEF